MLMVASGEVTGFYRQQLAFDCFYLAYFGEVKKLLVVVSGRQLPEEWLFLAGWGLEL